VFTVLEATMQTRNGIQLYSASDICNFLECQHLTSLDLQNLVVPIEKAAESDQNRLIQEKGLAHEAALFQPAPKPVRQRC
jgi:hypothetical protein